MKRIILSGVAASAVAAAVLVSLPGPAEAYQCKSTYTQAEAISKRKLKARASARKLWSDKAKSTLGLPWSVWKIANAKSVTCNHTGAAWHCMARAKPCLYVVP